MKAKSKAERPSRFTSCPLMRAQTIYGVTSEYLQEEPDESEDKYVCISPLDDYRKRRRPSDIKRYRHIAVVVSAASIYITLILSIAGFIVSYTSQSAGEFAFAADAVLGSVSSAMIIWRFYNGNEQFNPEKDKKACFIISLCFMGSAFVMLGETIVNFLLEKKARNTDAMLAISIIGFSCFAVLFIIKYWISEKLNSTALRADSFDSAAGGANALGLVLSTFVYKENPKVWFLDDCVALFITIVTLLYGVKLMYEVTCATKAKQEDDIKRIDMNRMQNNDSKTIVDEDKK